MNTLKSIFINLIILMLIAITSYGQNVGIGTINPDESAMLEVRSTTKGILIPRMTTAQRIAITNPATGLLVFDENTNSFWFYNGTSWLNLSDPDKGVFENASGVVRNTGDHGSDDFVFGSESLTGTNDTMFFFDKSKAAFRTGKISGNAWQPDSLGKYSFAAGFKPKAKGENSIAMGYNAQALDDSSISIGDNSESNEVGSIAIGISTKSKKQGAISIGNQTQSLDTNAVTIGYKSEASNNSAVAIGYETNASGKKSFAFGNNTTATSAYETVIGTFNETYCPYNENSYDYRDRLFVVGNGFNDSDRRNALTLLKSGKLGLGTADPPQQLTLTNSMQLPYTTAADTGIIYLGNDRFLHNYNKPGNQGGNTFLGINTGNLTLGGTNFDDGINNTGIGYKALNSLSEGSANSALGYLALSKTTTGNQNTAIGAFSMWNNESGYSNVSIGYAAMSDKTNSHYNTAVGYSAGYGSTSHQILGNSLFGYEAGDSLISGDYNVCIGYKAGDNITMGSNNIIIGKEIDAPVYDGSDQLMIGNIIYGNMDDLLIGINTTNPQNTMHIVGNDTLGSVMISPNESSNNDDASIFLSEDDDGTYGMQLKYEGITNQFQISGKTNNTIYPNHLVINRDDGRIGIGIDNPSAQLHVLGNSYHDGDFIIGGNSLTSTNDTLMFFDKSKGAFRFGEINNLNWQPDSIGNLSFAVGRNAKARHFSSIAMGPDAESTGTASISIGSGTKASGTSSLALGNSTEARAYGSLSSGFHTIASGDKSAVFGNFTQAASAMEFVIGNYNTSYTPDDAHYWDNDDRLFVIGNGTNDANRSDALRVMKNGKVGIGNHTPDHQLSIYGTDHTIDGTDGIFMDIQNANSLTDVLCGIRFRNGTAANTFKGGIFYQDKASYGRGNILFINNGINSSGNATAADARMIIEYNGKVGIGTTDIQSKLHVDGTEILSTGTNSGFKFRERGSTSALDDWVWYADSDYARLFENGTGDILIVKNTGLFGVGRTPTTNRFEVNGNASKTTAGDWYANSDARLKKNIKQLDGEEIIQKLLLLKGVNFEWNDNKTGYDRPTGVQYGLIAQDIQKVFPSLVIEDNMGYLQTAYGTYDAMYIEAIRTLYNKLLKLEDENLELKSHLLEMNNLKSEVEALKEKVDSIEKIKEF